MSKEYLQALNKIQHDFGQLKGQELVNCYETIFNALKRLEAIDNANPSEALEYFEEMAKYRIEYNKYLTPIKDISEYSTIKQALLKTQELETMASEYDLQPSQIREALLVFGMMQGAGYKVSDIGKAQKQEKENSKYKQLEEELGCLLEVVFKAITKGIWYETFGELQKTIQPVSFFVPIAIERKLDCIHHWYFPIYGHYIYLEDYKKTWWLKEDKGE